MNYAVGIASFTFALAAQGTKNVYLNSFICFIWVTIAHILVEKNKFPQHLRNLRKSKIEESRYLAKIVEKEHLNLWKIFKRGPLFIFGYIFLALLSLMLVPEYRNMKIFSEKTLPQIFLLEEEKPNLTNK